MYPLFQAKGCTNSSCHGGGSPSAGLDLSSAGAAYGELVNRPSSQCSRTLVVPNDAAASYLVNKLTGAGMCSGSRMPRNGTPLTTAELDVVRAWIHGGAN